MEVENAMIIVHDDIILEICFTNSVLGIHNAGVMLEELKKVSESNTKDIVLNMTSVTSIDSTAIATFVKFVQHLSGSKRVLTMSNVAPDIMKIFGMLKMSAFFKLKEKKADPS